MQNDQVRNLSRSVITCSVWWLYTYTFQSPARFHNKTVRHICSVQGTFWTFWTPYLIRLTLFKFLLCFPETAETVRQTYLTFFLSKVKILIYYIKVVFKSKQVTVIALIMVTG